MQLYLNVDLNGADLEKANRELDEILSLNEEERDDDISLTPQAFAAADKQLASSQQGSTPRSRS